MSNHTPGPWTVHDPIEEGIEHANGVTIESPEGTVALNVLEVDASLIAAAPDLLTALESLLSYATGDWQPQDDDLMTYGIDLAEAAINRAEGGGA